MKCGPNSSHIRLNVEALMAAKEATNVVDISADHNAVYTPVKGFTSCNH